MSVSSEVPLTFVVQAYRFALDPTADQVAMLRSHCGAQRFAFNWALRLISANLRQRAAERSYGIDETDLTPALGWSAYELRKRWNQAKGEIAPWWWENSKEAYSSGIANLSIALTNWSTSSSGDRRGPRVRFPRFKSRKTHASCRFTTGVIGLSTKDRRHVKLPRIGTVRTCESTRKLARRLDAGTARIRSATVSFRHGRWFVSFSVEVAKNSRKPDRTDGVVGVDLGVRHLAVLSEPVRGLTDSAGMLPNPKHLDRVRKKMRRLQRQAARRRLAGKSRPNTEPSKRLQSTNRRIARLYAKVTQARSESLHQLTATLASRFGTVVVEDLNVAGMLRNRRLSRSIADAGWGELRRQLSYKVRWNGGALVVADRWYPSSKTCSNPRCGVVKAKLHLSEREFRCEHCGLVIDRDRNAARNLARLAVRMAERPPRVAGRRKTSPLEIRVSPATRSAEDTATGTPRAVR
ncbi:IS607 family element RNA-guided endonuclease TnpB [Nocardia beijingensis]|uniref:IS607 family element RNA-guided endonuclease TnpB n=1 Tax=Nocardia beijingensis TaxID=95162 RepID=UPI000A076D2C|nr:IS607 family element RNA-guided endonuclease TnpB [Nocardia beijingensis]